ncbi:hypothetical protein AMECASPLE_023441 [Ameca splendens]|uniref:Uncharacterized protein n=1 Tax=Ameca splendens TaxID=208324 RepID=A0ABV0YR09_9TELE
MHHDPKQKSFKNDWKEQQRLPIFTIKVLWGVLDKQGLSTQAPPSSLQALKHQLLTSCCKLSQHIFRGKVEHIHPRITTILAIKVGKHTMRQVVLMLWLISEYFPNHSDSSDFKRGIHLKF